VSNDNSIVGNGLVGCSRSRICYLVSLDHDLMSKQLLVLVKMCVVFAPCTQTRVMGRRSG
jgi:hypothetical protein